MKSPLEKVLVGLIVLDVVLGILVTPAGGMDPRPPSGASALTWTCVGLYMVGIVLSLTAVVQLVRGKAVGPTLAMVAPVLFFGVITADRTNNFHAEVAPSAIATLEWCVAALSLVVIGLAAKVRSGARAWPFTPARGSPPLGGGPTALRRLAPRPPRRPRAAPPRGRWCGRPSSESPKVYVRDGSPAVEETPAPPPEFSSRCSLPSPSLPIPLGAGFVASVCLPVSAVFLGRLTVSTALGLGLARAS